MMRKKDDGGPSRGLVIEIYLAWCTEDGCDEKEGRHLQATKGEKLVAPNDCEIKCCTPDRTLKQ